MLVSNSNILKVNGSWLTPKINYNPLNLPPKTIRAEFTEGVTPTVGDSQTLVDAENNVWDITKNSASWSGLFWGNTSLIRILGANSEGVTNMYRFACDCSSLQSIALFDTSAVTTIELGFCYVPCPYYPLFDFHNVTNFTEPFYLAGIKEIPDWDVRSVTQCNFAFIQAYYVEKGAYNLYNKLNATGIVTDHFATFSQCGKDTVTGAAELAQIPSSWGGTAS